jgi:excinuclease ABC subunit B
MKQQLFKLKSNYQASDDQKKVIDEILDKRVQDQVLLGVTGSGKTFVMANVIEKLQKPTLILSHNKTLAAQLYEEFKEYFPENAVKYFVSYYDYYQPEAYLPSRDLYIEKESDINKEIERFRLSAMNSVLTRKDVVIVASVSCIYNIGDPGNYENKTINLKVGDSISISNLSRELTFIQYEREKMDFEPGSFRVKGDVVEIFPPYEESAIRIELWGETIERISVTDPLTGQRLKDLQNIEIFPSKNFVFEKEVINDATRKIENDLKNRIEFFKKQGKELEAQRIEQKTKYDLEMLREIGYCKGMENYSIYFENRTEGSPPFTLMDYFPKDYTFFIDESHMTIPQVGGMFEGDRARKETLIEYGFRLPTAKDNRPLNFAEFLERRGNTVYVSATPGPWEKQQSKSNVTELLTRPTGLVDPEITIHPTENQIDNVIEEISKTIAKKQRVLITTLTKKMAEDLTSYLQDIDIKVQYLHSDVDTVERVDILRDLRLGKYDVLVGINLLREGIDLPEVSLVLILDADKEGFLRSKTSLIQTIGRAARHVDGRVILYADKMTDSIKYAISETERRREYQIEYNKKHGIIPQSITKDIRAKFVDEKIEMDEKHRYEKWIKDNKPSEKEIKKVLKELEEKMMLASENLQFEKAAEYRDQIEDLKENLD